MSAEGLLLLTALLAVSLLVLDLAREDLRSRRDRRNLSRMGERTRPAESVADEEAGGQEATPYRTLGPIARRQRAAGLPLSTLTLLAILLFAGLFAGLSLRKVLPAVPLAAVAAGVLGAYLPWFFLGTWGRRRANRFESQLADALGFMVGSLEAGENPRQAIATAAAASDGIARRELAAVAYHLDLGMEIERALRPIREGYDAEGVRLFVQTLTAKWQVGGDLVPILRSVSRVIRERARVRLRLRSHLAGARVASVAIALLPYVVIPVFLWQLPNLIDRLLTHPLGPSLLVMAVLLQIIGWLWLARILRVEL